MGLTSHNETRNPNTLNPMLTFCPQSFCFYPACGGSPSYAVDGGAPET